MRKSLSPSSSSSSSSCSSSDAAPAVTGAATDDEKKRRVGYFYEANMGCHFYGRQHHMQPQRLKMTHELITSLDLGWDLLQFEPRRAEESELERFHSRDYVDFFRSVSTLPDWQKLLRPNKFNLAAGEGDGDCPIVDGMFDFQALCSGASIEAASLINNRGADIAINWAGGLHHAKRRQAYGFCYLNDIVLCILELLTVHNRVMYIDIDIHHGDGVEEAFWHSNRVLTVSFHMYDGNFFPGTGHLDDRGELDGKGYSVNVPLKEGVDDECFLSLSRPVIGKCVEQYRPDVIVLQCGADSLRGDMIGEWNMSIRGHGECVEFCRGFGIPLVILGGGGYTVENVSRCWAYETAVCLGVQACDLPSTIPLHDFSAFYAEGKHQLLFERGSRVPINKNSVKSVNDVRTAVLRAIGEMEAVPSVPIRSLHE